MEFNIGQNVCVEWINERYKVHRFLFGTIIDVISENSTKKYKVKYNDDLSRWESGLKVEWWDEEHIKLL